MMTGWADIVGLPFLIGACFGAIAGMAIGYSKGHTDGDHEGYCRRLDTESGAWEDDY